MQIREAFFISTTALTGGILYSGFLNLFKPKVYNYYDEVQLSIERFTNFGFLVGGLIGYTMVSFNRNQLRLENIK
tara:strand:- start:30700 stop:30924 length:225 start_codon:yes stop_codon:yes gene_type:complete